MNTNYYYLYTDHNNYLLVGLALSLGGIFITLVLDQSAMIVINSIDKNELAICNEDLDDEEHRNNHNDHSHHHEHCEIEMASAKRSADGFIIIVIIIISVHIIIKLFN